MAPLSILHLVNSLGAGGAERFTFDLAVAQAAAGHEVAILSLSTAAELGDTSGVEARRIKQLHNSGIDHQILGHRHRRWLISATAPLRRILAERRPDIVHAHLLTALLMLRLAGRRPPVVATHHNTALPTSPAIFRAGAARASALVAISKPALPILEQVYRGPIELIHNGISDHGTAPKPRDGAGPLRVISLGHMKPAKNYLHLVEIAATLRDRGLEVEFQIAGDGPERVAVERRIAELGLPDSIALLGSREDTASLLAASDLYLLTSTKEGMPIALIEAMQAGLPIVSSDVGGCAEVIGLDGEAGFLVPPGDTAAFAERIATLAGDRSLRERMGLVARERAKLFTIETAARYYEALYRRVLT
ncbi:MAG: glycosyltransferase [Pseudomonadota bacterium]